MSSTGAQVIAGYPLRSSSKGRVSEMPRTPAFPIRVRRLTMAKLKSLDDLLVHELQDIYHAEGQILKALPKMIKAANHPAWPG